MNNRATVSLIVTARNEAEDIEACLNSLLAQDHKCEVILVDNGSTDGTAEIAKRLGVRVEQRGPERSSQRNYGARVAQCDFVCFLDADMIAPSNMVSECLELMKDDKVGAVVIPEESFGEGFWTECKILERSCYPPGSFIEAARFYRSSAFKELNGFDEELTGLEDLDLHQRCGQRYKIKHSQTAIRHHEGRIRFVEQLRKKYYYGKNSWTYARKHPDMFRKQSNPFRGYFLKNWKALAKHPFLSPAMLFLKICELISGGIGIFAGRIKSSFRQFKRTQSKDSG